MLFYFFLFQIKSQQCVHEQLETPQSNENIKEREGVFFPGEFMIGYTIIKYFKGLTEVKGNSLILELCLQGLFFFLRMSLIHVPCQSRCFQ